MNIKTLKVRLENYLEAERRVLSGQSYRVGSRELTRANLSDIRAAIEDISNQIEMLESSGRGNIREVIF